MENFLERRFYDTDFVQHFDGHQLSWLRGYSAVLTWHTQGVFTGSAEVMSSILIESFFFPTCFGHVLYIFDVLIEYISKCEIFAGDVRLTLVYA